MTISTSRGSYEVVIGSGILGDELSGYSAVIVDPVVERSVESVAEFIPFQARESEKTLQGVEQLLIDMHAIGLNRGSAVAAVGGGVIQDVATLAASLYMRGLPWAYAPTTMMAMLDSCIGGKSSINVTGIKNLVGNIYPPTRVVVDVALAETLPTEARVAGYAEAVKICYAGGPAALNTFLELVIPADSFGAPTTAVEAANLTEHVLSVKKWFIETDEFDRRERLLLNFGHTFGHALEAALDFALPHGVAIAIGMNAALRFSPVRSGKAVTLEEYIYSLATQLPEDFRSCLMNPDWDRFDRALASDKKGSATHIRFVLEGPDSSLGIIERERNSATINQAREAAHSALVEFRSFCGSRS
jgi:3-dehydroquinate synthase